MSGIERDGPVYVAGLEGGEGKLWLCYDLPSSGSGTSPGGKRRQIQGGGSTARISNYVKPQDPGGGEGGFRWGGGVAVVNTPPAVFADMVTMAVTSLLEWLLLMWLLWPMLGWSP